MDKKTNFQEYNYILIDNTDPMLMWNCAVSIIVFLLLLFFIYMNWRPICANVFENMPLRIDEGTIGLSDYSSVGGRII